MMATDASLAGDAALVGLSNLQFLILAVAGFHRRTAPQDAAHPHCYALEVMALRWGFPTSEGHPLPPRTSRAHVCPQLPKAALGRQYTAARVSVSKAFRRLEAKGLITRHRYPGAEGVWHLGVVLTPAGVPWANDALDFYGGTWPALVREAQG